MAGHSDFASLPRLGLHQGMPMRRNALFAMAALFACGFNTGGFKVEPGPVEVTQGQHTASGAFRLIVAPDGDPATEMPDGKPGVTGGGCLVFQEARVQVSCSKQGLECDSHKPDAAGSAYCDLSAGATGTCWFRPTSDPCYRSKLDRLVRDMPHALTMDQSPLPTPTKIRWRLMTCQGLVTGGCGKPGIVENVDYRLRWGPVTEP
jgi:hypothetical protein